jgi:serine/threonine protein kinase
MKVLDFGLAKILDETIGITQAATVGNFMMCSPRYAAPEQFDPKIGAVGPWTDVYSLALVLLEALRDEKVRKGDGLIGCMEEAVNPKTDISAKALGMQLPPRIEAALARAVMMNPQARQKTAGELWEEIKAAMRERVSSAWAAPVPVALIPEGSEPSTRSPASLGADTIVDPVFSVPAPSDALGGTMMMDNAPPRPSYGALGSQPPPPQQAGAPSQPPPGTLAAYMRAGLAPVAGSHSPPETITAVTPRRSRAPAVVTILLLVILGALGAGGFLAWRSWKAHGGTWPGSTTP